MAFEKSARSIAPELQNVLTHYVDSVHGYEQVAALISEPHMAAAFREIAASRREVGGRIAGMIHTEGEQPALEGSTEGVLHRWWIRLREKLSDEELGMALSECVRGEKALASTLEEALTNENLTVEEKALLTEAHAEVLTSIIHFETALDD